MSSNAYGLVTFDLKSVQKIKNVAIAYSSDFYGLPAPGELDVAYSTDNSTWTSFVNTGAVFNNDMNSVHIYNTVFTLPETYARYVKLKIHCSNDDGGNWFFISEVKFQCIFRGFR